MRLCVVGTGYVGLVAGAGFAEFGNQVLCADVDVNKISRLKQGEIPIYEPGLEPIVIRNVSEERLTFTTDVASAVSDVDAVFIAVGTPPGPDGSADLSHIWNVAKIIAKNASGFTVVITKSTVPVGTGDRILSLLHQHGPGKDFAVVSNPEFLKEGDAVNDFMKPQRVVIGANDDRAARLMHQLYAPFTRTRDRILLMDLQSAEVTKYACNAMLATRISFMNEMARLCSRVGADINHVREGMCWDDRIGSKFLFPGVGYGGSCFPKDVKAIIKTAHAFDINLQILHAVETVNTEQKKALAQMIIEHFDGSLQGKIIALWGLAFKPETDDVREAPAKVIADLLLEAGATLRLHDPIAQHTFEQLLAPGKQVIYCKNNYEAAQNADALALITEWKSYRSPDFKKLKSIMRQSTLFDGRNIWSPDFVRSFGFSYTSIGRP